jgi:hypothetical protein
MPLDELDQFLSSVPGPQQPEDELDKYLRAQEQSKRPSPPVEVSVDGKVVAPKSPQIDVLKAEVPDRMTKLRMKTVEDEVAGKGPRVLRGRHRKCTSDY